MKKNFPKIKIILLLLLFSFFGCKEKAKILPVESAEEEKIPIIKVVSNPEKEETFHVDTTYKYEYRTGESGSYQYHYDVIGEDSEGNVVNGTIDVEGKYGIGNLNDEFGNKINVTVEWIDYGILKAIDKNENIYQLKAQ